MAGERREVVVYFKGVERDLVRSSETAKRSLGSVATTAAKVGIGIAAGFAARQVVSEIGKSIGAQSDLRESVNKTNVIFGDSGKQVQRWARQSVFSLGLTRQEALSNASAFGDMFDQLGIGRPRAVSMSQAMVKLGADFASFHNADITDVLLAQQSAFRGEYDALQRFVPGINAARVEQEALRITHKASKTDLNNAEKAQAAYNIMLRDGKRASGDFGKTSEELANGQRIAKAALGETRAEMGRAFLPAARRLTNHFNQELAPEMLRFARENAPAMGKAIDDVTVQLLQAAPSAEEFSASLRQALDWVQREGPKVGENIGRVTKSLVDAKPAAHDLAVEADGLHDAVRVTGIAFSFLADHADTLAKTMPVLVAAWGALKLAQGAAHIAAVAEVVTMPGRIAATILLARSNQALARSYVEISAGAGSAAVAQGAASTATAAGSAIAGGAAVSWGALLPIFAGLGTALWVGADAMRALKGGTLDARDPVTLLADKVFGLDLGLKRVTESQREEEATAARAADAQERHATAMGAARTASAALSDALDDQQTAGLDLRQSKLTLATAQQRVTQLTRDGKKGSNEYKQAQIDLERAQIDLKAKTDAYRSAQGKASAATSGAMYASMRAQGAYKSFSIAALGAGKQAYTMGVRAAAGLRLVKSKHVNVQATFGFKTPPNVSMHDITGKTGGLITPAGVVARRMQGGGPVRGAGTGTSDDVPLWGSNGEYMVRAPAVRAVGRDTLDWINAQGMAGGGPVLNADLPSGRAVGQVAGRFVDVIESGIARLAKRFASFAQGFGIGMGGKAGMGWAAQMAVLRTAFPGLALISGFRPGAITATGNRSYHASGRAVDIPPNMAVFNWIRAMFGGRSRELIFTPAGARQIHNGRPHVYTGITARNHVGHIHWAMGRGGNAVLRAPAALMDLATGAPLALMGENGPEHLNVTPVSPGRTRVDTSGAAAGGAIIVDLTVTIDGHVLERRLERVRAKSARRDPGRGGR